jgi:RNA polymerase sigma-70 factor (ECF subfamily)
MSDNSDSSLVELLDRARGGDDAARDRLFARCRNYVSVVARTQVEGWMKAKVDASDLVQQTLLEAHRSFVDFRGTTEAEWLAWLKQILSHNTTDFVRRYRGTDKRRVQREVPIYSNNGDGSAAFFRDPSDPGESPSQLVARHEREVEVAEAISQLSPDHQDVILLRNLQRLPFNEVAERMGRSRPAVQMLWMRALRKLQEILEEQDA